MMATLLVSLIVASWFAAVVAGERVNLFGQQAESFEAIAIPVTDQQSTYAARAAYRHR